ncbi:hypothetical protein GCM10010425_22070 [Streptomyces spororaveus]|uniref:hypothetical protein n=1 Tax=Streptomyces spororaveus TaxID=284039 RepID=UPI0033771450
MLRHARAEAARRGARLLRTHCWAGEDGRVVREYEAWGFTAILEFEQPRSDGSFWTGQVLQTRVCSGLKRPHAGCPVRALWSGCEDERVSFDLAVLAMEASADAVAVRAMYDRCTSGSHAEGEVDERVMGFYESLRSRFPDHPPLAGAAGASPWMSTPLSVGIDHVVMNLSFSAGSDDALRTIEELAAEYCLVIWDPQSQDAYFPPSVTTG